MGSAPDAFLQRKKFHYQASAFVVSHRDPLRVKFDIFCQNQKQFLMTQSLYSMSPDQLGFDLIQDLSPHAQSISEYHR